MTDIVDRLRAEIVWERDVSETLYEAADEIERLRAQLDSCVRTMNICIADYQKLRQVALDGDTLVAYRLGVKHGSEGEPKPPFRNRASTSNTQPKPVAESSKEQQAPVAWAADIPGKYGAAPTMLFGYTKDLVKSIAASGGDFVEPFPLYHNQHIALTDAERDAIQEACDEGRWYPNDYRHIHTLRSLLERTK
jgi:hypothetical protein